MLEICTYQHICISDGGVYYILYIYYLCNKSYIIILLRTTHKLTPNIPSCKNTIE
jgi:hypothetical protein